MMEITLPTNAQIEEIAAAAFAAIPETLRLPLGDIVFRVEDFPNSETCDALELDSPYDLLGLYHGIDLLNKSTLQIDQDLDHIFLYRRPILAYCQETGESLADVVAHVLIHEIGHHYGFSDEDMHRLEEDDPS